jgi:peptidoglycan/LPS O-acetylase OafA/YrhL
MLAKRSILKSEQNHIPALDGVRGLAVLFVFLLHYGGGAQSSNVVLGTVGKAFKLGWSGVTLFFVLSGFLITGILWRSFGTEHWWRAFYTRRCLRIFPLYYFALLLVLSAGFVLHKAGQFGAPLGICALYLQGFPTHVDLTGVSPFSVGHFWSLAVEEHFYLFWPFLLVMMPTARAARYLCVGVMAVSLAFRVWVVYAGATGFFYFTPARMGELALGAWLALAVYENPAWLNRVRRLALPIMLVSFCAAIVLADLTHDLDLRKAPMYLAGLPLFSVGYAAMILLSLQKGMISRLFSFVPLRHLGVISYGIYVYHVLFIEFYKGVVNRLFPHASRNLQLGLIFVVAAVLTLAIAEVSYWFFERPFLKLKRKFTPGERMVEAEAGAKGAAV